MSMDETTCMQRVMQARCMPILWLFDVQVLLFSATLHSPEVKELAGQICVTPTLVDLKGMCAFVCALLWLLRLLSGCIASVCYCIQGRPL